MVSGATGIEASKFFFSVFFIVLLNLFVIQYQIIFLCIDTFTS